MEGENGKLIKVLFGTVFKFRNKCVHKERIISALFFLIKSIKPPSIEWFRTHWRSNNTKAQLITVISRYNSYRGIYIGKMWVNLPITITENNMAVISFQVVQRNYRHIKVRCRIDVKTLMRKVNFSSSKIPTLS